MTAAQNAAQFAGRPRRSALYMPAGNARAIEKARTLPADAVILDLEDSMAPDAKDAARAMAVDAVRGGGFGPREVVVRINGLDTPWGAEDLEAAAAAGPNAILLPKVSSPEDLAAGAGVVRGRARLWAMIETCQAVFRLDALAAASRSLGVDVWVIGGNDLVKEMRCTPGDDRAPLIPALALSVMAARAHGLTILDGVYNDIADMEGFAAECAQGRDMGFDGKTLIHPSQIEACNAVFSPSAEESAQAHKIIAAFDRPENAGKGVVQIDGRMVERMHADMARRTVAIADAIAAKGG